MELVEITYHQPRKPIKPKPYNRLYANNIVGVQPLLGPTGLIYYLRHQHSQNKGNGLSRNNLSETS